MSRPSDAAGGRPTDYLDMRLGSFLAAVANGSAAPGGGSAAATAVAIGAGLCAMTARLSVHQLTEDVAATLIADADRLRAAAAAQIQADADSYQGVLSARRNPADAARSTSAAPTRADRIATALAAASAVPFQVIQLAAEVARLAARLAADGNPNLRGDSVTGLLLAEAGAKAAALLVQINLANAPEDERLATTRLLLDEVADAVRAELA